MGYAVLHINKGGKSAKGLGNHNDRQRAVLNADPEKRGDNFRIVPVEDNKGNISLKAKTFSHYTPEKDLDTRIKERIKEGYKGTKEIRQDAVKHLDVILTGSHKEMKEVEKDTKNLIGWAADNYRFMAEKFGIDNIVSFTVHLDERTPHIHATVVPLTPDGRLSAKEMMGDRKKLQKLQTDYATKMQPYGLERGLQGSRAKHTSVKEFYAIVEDTNAQIENIPEHQPVQKLEGNFMGMVSAEKYKEQITHLEAIIETKNQKLRETMKINKTLSKQPYLWQKRDIALVNQLAETQNKVKGWVKTADLILEGNFDQREARKMVNTEMIKLGLKEPEKKAEVKKEAEIKKAEEVKKPIPKNRDFGIG
jgi:chaperonin cofactor prefoldin